ncbi:bifunctional adenosylcobinamide kinase/adenosylcobinamide-phosphate guanylyltransferase [Candidatus Electronema sp. PJ]|uniref:bifunctional adenosylcobinamide kinase/adenosylcobinamide-phosphate guanylyltransferase n=1 Tax=Candidatus Electronema sp. PJ TaxID=3401572 RepID=UPI003AA9E177
MALTLITGGSRSGKSAFAQHLAEGIDVPRCFLATCPRIDPEMDGRILRHQRERQGKGWQTVEEPLCLADVLRCRSAEETVLIDCLTLWISNLMHEAEQQGRELNEEHISALTEELCRVACARQGKVILVSGEVGLGIVPDNPASRLFRDLTGRCNQVAAAAAEEVFLVCCGIPIKIK